MEYVPHAQHATSSAQQAPTLSTREDLIRQQGAEVPFPVAGVTTYSSTLMPGFQPGVFESPDDMVANQLNVRDIDDTLVRPWTLHTVLVDGALIMVKVNLVAWVIREKFMCHLVTEDINVYHRPGQPLCGTVRSPPSGGSQPDQSSSTSPAFSFMSALNVFNNHMSDFTSQPGASSGSMADPYSANGANKHAKGNDGAKVPKGAGRDKAKAKEKDIMQNADWEDVE